MDRYYANNGFQNRHMLKNTLV